MASHLPSWLCIVILALEKETIDLWSLEPSLCLSSKKTLPSIEAGFMAFEPLGQGSQDLPTHYGTLNGIRCQKSWLTMKEAGIKICWTDHFLLETSGS